MNIKDAWIETNSGRKFNLFDPDPLEFHIPDFIHGICKEQRFGNQLDDNYSVAQHLLSCYQYSRHMNFSEYVQFLVLIHDLEEGLTGDIVGPVKHCIPVLSEACKKVYDIIHTQIFKLRPPEAHELAVVKSIDKKITNMEAVHLNRNKCNWVSGDIAPLSYLYMENSFTTLHRTYTQELSSLYNKLSMDKSNILQQDYLAHLIYIRGV